jgi:hypothetical protein
LPFHRNGTQPGSFPTWQRDLDSNIKFSEKEISVQKLGAPNRPSHRQHSQQVFSLAECTRQMRFPSPSSTLIFGVPLSAVEANLPQVRKSSKQSTLLLLLRCGAMAL